MFSVVITAFNRAWCIERAIESVLRQSEPDFEVVVSDDGSTDGTADLIAQKYVALSGQVRCVRSDANKGMFHAQMLGVQSSMGQYIVFLDSDDELLPDALRNFSKHIHRAVGVDAFFQTLVDDDGSVKGQFPSLLAGQDQRIFNYGDMCRLFAIGDYLPCVQTEVMRRSDYFAPVSDVSAYTHNLWYNLFVVADVLYTRDVGGVVHLGHADRRTKNQASRAGIWLKGVEYFLYHHGSAIRRHGGQLRKCYMDASRFAFQSGQRGKALAYFIRAVLLEAEFRLVGHRKFM
ncbi:MAG: glycosyltransferase family 2 protein [Aquabacterium sp.]|nr:glycosyltransferase family 2 protein [Aquabacterium sp.]